MTRALPIVFLIAAGLCLTLVLYWLWQSLRYLLLGRRALAHAELPRDAQREALLREKHELLSAIRDVRVERDLGKISADDFERLEQGYRGRARDVLRELETQVAPYRAEARSLLDAAAGAGGAQRAGAGSSTPAVSGAGTVACLSCGAANDRDAIFCKKCGTKMREGEAMV
jgi:hypothetical protein